MQQAEEAQAALARALQRGRHADPGVGIAQEFRAEGRAAAEGARAASSNPEVDFKRQKRSNETHASTTDPDARLFTKSKKAKASLPAFMGHVLMDNRSKLAVDTRLTRATGQGRTQGSPRPAGEPRRAAPFGGNKNYDTDGLRQRLPRAQRHPACGAEHVRVRHQDRQASVKRESRIDGRTTRHEGYAGEPSDAQDDRDAVWGWQAAWRRRSGRSSCVDRSKVSDVFTLAMLAVNLRRLPELLAAQAMMAGKRIDGRVRHAPPPRQPRDRDRRGAAMARAASSAGASRIPSRTAR